MRSSDCGLISMPQSSHPQSTIRNTHSGDSAVSLMLEEIAQQPEALARTIAEERGKAAKLGSLLRSKDVDLIVLVARGSSDNAALFGRYLLEVTTGIPVSLTAPSVVTLYGRSEEHTSELQSRLH